MQFWVSQTGHFHHLCCAFKSHQWIRQTRCWKESSSAKSNPFCPTGSPGWQVHRSSPSTQTSKCRQILLTSLALPGQDQVCFSWIWGSEFGWRLSLSQWGIRIVGAHSLLPLFFKWEPPLWSATPKVLSLTSMRNEEMCQPRQPNNVQKPQHIRALSKPWLIYRGIVEQVQELFPTPSLVLFYFIYFISR